MGSKVGKEWPRSVEVRKYAESRGTELESLHAILYHRMSNDFRCRRNKRRRTTGFNTNNKNSDNQDKKKLSRRLRRRIELNSNPLTGFTLSGDGTRRLRTHLWHAKRFTFANLWGFYLPLQLHGRGRGSRALLKWYTQGVVVHDASYDTAVQLDGPQDSLLSILSSVLVPQGMDCCEDVPKLLSGQIYGSAVLHYGTREGFKAICSVTYMWRPSRHQDSGVGIEDQVVDESTKAELGSHFRRLWIWIHPSAFVEAFGYLKLACQNKMDETGVLVDCVSLEGKLGKLEVMGSRASHLLRKILHPWNNTTTPGQGILQPCTSSYMEGFFETGDKTEHGSEQSTLKTAEDLSYGTIASLPVIDPRSLPVERSAAVPEFHLSSKVRGLSEEKKKDHSAVNLHMKERELCVQQSTYETDFSLSNCMDLWDVGSEVISPPAKENVLCLERQKKSLDFFCLKDQTSAESTSTETDFFRLCPIMLLKDTDRTGVFTWKDCLISHQIFLIAMLILASWQRKLLKLRKRWNVVLLIRPLRIPIPPPWTGINPAFDKAIEQVNGTDVSSNMMNHRATDLGCEVVFARTSSMLTFFLKEVSGDQLLLFPKSPNRKSFSHLMKDDAKLSEASKALTNHRRKLCYLRVLLHAYKDGVFDEGAVICAPLFSDLSLWMSRSSNNDGGLQVPDGSLGSSGEWEFQLPEDPAARKAYRQPIGFVTTGFVRGSKKPTAVGFCEARLLARLRQEQWSKMPRKRRRKEIYVLVRNLRSTAYRLALATIILEEQQVDVKSF